MTQSIIHIFTQTLDAFNDQLFFDSFICLFYSNSFLLKGMFLNFALLLSHIWQCSWIILGRALKDHSRQD